MAQGTLIKIDRNGSKHYEGYVECPRCMGKGIYYIGVLNGQLQPSWVDNGICFQCGGSGKIHGKWIERTPEYQAKLDAKREAKRLALEAKWQAEEAEREAKRIEEEAKAEAERKAKEEAEKARKAISNHVGNIGDKLDLNVTYAGSAFWDQKDFYGFGYERMYIHKFNDSEGNLLVWKTQKDLARSEDGGRTWIYPEAGDQVQLKGTIKDHAEYKEEKQTVLTRCKVIF